MSQQESGTESFYLPLVTVQRTGVRGVSGFSREQPIRVKDTHRVGLTAPLLSSPPCLSGRWLGM